MVLFVFNYVLLLRGYDIHYKLLLRSFFEPAIIHCGRL